MSSSCLRLLIPVHHFRMNTLQSQVMVGEVSMITGRPFTVFHEAWGGAIWDFVSTGITEKGEIEISNRYLFTNLKDLQTVWMLQGDGEIPDQGIFPLNLEPQKT